MRQIGLQVGAVLGLVCIGGCGVHIITNITNSGVTGSGVVKTETRPVSGFDGVTLNGIGKVVITQNGKESLTVHAEDNLLPLLQTHVVDGKLRLETKPDANLNPTKPIKFDIDVKTLSSLDVSGAGDLEASKIQGKALTVSLTGAGNASLSGQVTDLSLTISGAGDVAAENLQAQQATVSSTGAGNVVVNAKRQLTVTLTGAGDVEYLGSPKVQQSISGVGTVTHRN